jgi:hypothetical protein
MQAIVDDEDGAPTASSTAGLPGADGADADVDTGERHELVCPFHFFFIQDSEDEDGHPVGKVCASRAGAPAWGMQLARHCVFAGLLAVLTSMLRPCRLRFHACNGGR